MKGLRTKFLRVAVASGAIVLLFATVSVAAATAPAQIAGAEATLSGGKAESGPVRLHPAPQQVRRLLDPTWPQDRNAPTRGHTPMTRPRRHSRTVSVRVSRLGLLSGWRRCSPSVTRFPNDPR